MTETVNAEALLRDVWRRVYAFARRKSSRVPRLSLFVGCQQILNRRKHDKRSFCHVGHVAGKVCTVLATAKLPLKYIYGLMVHEISHPLAQRLWGRSEQSHADSAAAALLGLKIHYGGPLILQYLSASDVKKVLS